MRIKATKGNSGYIPGSGEVPEVIGGLLSWFGVDIGEGRCMVIDIVEPGTTYGSRPFTHLLHRVNFSRTYSYERVPDLNPVIEILATTWRMTLILFVFTCLTSPLHR